MENSKPLVSIIVPVYNAERYLRECVDSIATQTYGNLEIILVDDGSTDSSGNICDDLSDLDGRIRVIHKVNGGVSSARNVGIDAALGEYLMFVDSDDTIIPESIELMLKKSQEYNADIVSAGLLDYGREKSFENGVSIWAGDEALRQSLSDHPRGFSMCSKLYRTQVLGDSRFAEGVKINEDTLLLFEIFCKQPTVVNIEDRIYFYRPNDRSASRAVYSEKFEDILRVADKKRQMVSDKFPELLPLAENMMLKSRMNLLQILCVRTRKEKKKLERELIKHIKKNCRSYISMSPYDDRWLKIIRFNLYYVYKLAYRFKNKA